MIYNIRNEAFIPYTDGQLLCLGIYELVKRLDKNSLAHVVTEAVAVYEYGRIKLAMRRTVH